MRAVAFERVGAHGEPEVGYRAVIMLGNLLDVLAPNKVLEEQFRTGYRAAMCKRDKRKPPDDLYRVATCVKVLRNIAAVAFATVGQLGAVCRVVFALSTPRALDDDGWLFLVKPVLDGMTDAGCWTKDRRVIPYLAGHVDREEWSSDVLDLSVHLL